MGTKANLVLCSLTNDIGSWLQCSIWYDWRDSTQWKRTATDAPNIRREHCCRKLSKPFHQCIFVRKSIAQAFLYLFMYGHITDWVIGGCVGAQCVVILMFLPQCVSTLACFSLVCFYEPVCGHIGVSTSALCTAVLFVPLPLTHWIPHYTIPRQTILKYDTLGTLHFRQKHLRRRIYMNKWHTIFMFCSSSALCVVLLKAEYSSALSWTKVQYNKQHSSIGVH